MLGLVPPLTKQFQSKNWQWGWKLQSNPYPRPFSSSSTHWLNIDGCITLNWAINSCTLNNALSCWRDTSSHLWTAAVARYTLQQNTAFPFLHYTRPLKGSNNFPVGHPNQKILERPGLYNWIFWVAMNHYFIMPSFTKVSCFYMYVPFNMSSKHSSCKCTHPQAIPLSLAVSLPVFWEKNPQTNATLSFAYST